VYVELETSLPLPSLRMPSEEDATVAAPPAPPAAPIPASVDSLHWLESSVVATVVLQLNIRLDTSQRIHLGSLLDTCQVSPIQLVQR
jgi:hypothetical protein